MTSDLQPGESGTVEAYVETVRLRILRESALEPPAASEAPGCSFDPYNTNVGALAAGPRPRRSLDDMRRLSEAIVRNRLRAKGAA
jgi:hypothetical protein